MESELISVLTKMRLALIILQRPGFISLWMASVSATYFDFIPVINSTSHLFVRVKGFCFSKSPT